MAETKGRVIGSDERAAVAADGLHARRKGAGRNDDIRDIMIAAGRSLATRNIKHFADAPITVTDPWTN